MATAWLLGKQKMFQRGHHQGPIAPDHVENTFTLEIFPNLVSMIDLVKYGGGYTGMEYKKVNSRNNNRSTEEGVIEGIRVDYSDYEEGFVDISHVAAQEGLAWRSEE